MTMQEILVTRGADLAEPQLRSAMVTLAGTEPSTLFGMSAALGAGSPDKPRPAILLTPSPLPAAEARS